MRAILAFFSLCIISIAKTVAQQFPLVDLGYATHAPTYINTTASGTLIGLYNNIRFAQPPTGALRFRKPRTPPPSQKGIQDGRDRLFSTDCVNAAPDMVPFPGLNGSAFGQEDCLFLNVWVPEGVRPGDNIPVIHWLHGSAYAFGSKDLLTDAMGLMDLIRRPEDRFIFVASNYRLGLYGWASSPYEDMDANVGLHDSVAALQWTKNYISYFGGDANNIAAIGESAGAAMIALMLVANGGNETLPFQKAFISSPAMLPRRNVSARREEVYNHVLQAANCSSLECLRSSPPSLLFDVNKQLLINTYGGGGGGTFGPGVGFGPLPDGEYIPDAMTVLFNQGRYNKDIKAVVSGNMAAEGFATTPDIYTPEELNALIRKVLPGGSNATVQRIRDLYPYSDSQVQKIAQDWTTDSVWACNSQAIANAYANKTQRYVFSVPPASHGMDVNYMFFKDNDSTPVESVSLARQFQSQILQFSRDSVGTRNTIWPLYSTGSKTANFTLAGLETGVDPWAVEPNCDMILEAIMDRSNGA
ncbi:carboxyl ester lipase [Aspergillus avenaceus]|uniref:Carboxyl ester lipase n=1 Tax=Aspergillus avenaceus TaxID=36643 RepID=A0A5N6TYA5_ASPAV|nr:carboxyl ester lipase [Aspergillus avenaceus]